MKNILLSSLSYFCCRKLGVLVGLLGAIYLMYIWSHMIDIPEREPYDLIFKRLALLYVLTGINLFQTLYDEQHKTHINYNSV